MDGSTGRADLSLALDLAEIERAQRFARAFWSAHGGSEQGARRLELVVEELMTNTVSHGDAPAASRIEIRLAAEDGALVLDYRDRGRRFDPERDCPPDPRALEPAARRAGGLGWPLIKHYCRSLRYAREGDVNHLRLDLVLEPPAR